MRVRITRRRSGEIDGIDLSAFDEGVTYEVSASLGTYLIMTSSAEPVIEHLARSLPTEEVQTKVAVTAPHEIAADTGAPASNARTRKN
jgi:hypothetical protein